MNIIPIIPASKNSRKILFSILQYDFFKDSKIDTSLLSYIRIAFVLFSKKKKIVGMAGLYNKVGAYDLFIVIDEPFRNAGLGKILLKKIIRWSQKRKIIFFIQTFNTKFYRPALKLYISCGFKRKFYFGKRVILMKRERITFITIYRIVLFYLSSLKYIFKKKV
jgi:GNAT superfamily N-acetyltransferase